MSERTTTHSRSRHRHGTSLRHVLHVPQVAPPVPVTEPSERTDTVARGYQRHRAHHGGMTKYLMKPSQTAGTTGVSVSAGSYIVSVSIVSVSVYVPSWPSS